MSDLFISLVYVFLLGFLGFYAMTDFLKLRKAGADTKIQDPHGGGKPAAASGTTGIAQKLQAVNLPPMITFDEDLVPGGNRISGVFVAICGFFVGVVAAIMGVGGGFLAFPMFVYLLGVSSFTTVGTDILQIIFTAGYAAITQYAIYGFIFYTLAMGMLLGSLLGIQVGALTTKVVKGIYIRGFYAITILAGFFNRFFALPKKLNEMEYIDISPGLASFLDILGLVIFFLIAGTFAFWVFYMFFTNIKKLRGGLNHEHQKNDNRHYPPRHLFHGFNRHLHALVRQRTEMAWSFPMTSLIPCPKAPAILWTTCVNLATPFKGQAFEVELKFKDADTAKKIEILFTKAGATVEAAGTALKVKGDLGQVMSAAIDDSDCDV